jgi:hypothetical protein
MNIIYGGTEVGSNRTLLESMGVTRMALSFYALKKRGLPQKKLWLVSEHFLPGLDILVDSGIAQAERDGLSKEELTSLGAEYQEFVANNLESILGFVEADSQTLGLEWILQERASFEHDPKLWVVWHESYGLPVLRQWAKRYSNIAIPHATIEACTSLAGVTRGLSSQYGTKFHALGSAKPDNLRQIPFTTATTLSWLSPMRNGETIIWDGTKVVRYPKKMMGQARKRYSSVIAKANLDYDAFLKNNGVESSKVAVWSYQQLEKSMDKKRPDLHIIDGGKEPLLSDNSETPLLSTFAETWGDLSDNSDLEMRKDSAVEEPKKLIERDPTEVTSLPVFGYKMKTIVDVDDEGNEVLKEVPLVQTSGTSLRQCDTCFVASNCPAFKPQNSCAFNLPVAIQTKEQLKALLNAVIEMQGARVAFSRFAEELNGGYPDPNTSQEIDRLFKLVKGMKELEENREFIRITAERQSSGGVLSAIFGDRAQALKDLPNGGLNEAETTKIIQQSLE